MSRNLPLRLLPDALVNDEEETLLSSIPRIRRDYFFGSISTQLLLSMGTILGEEAAGSFLCGFAFAFDRHDESFASSCNACSSG